MSIAEVNTPGPVYPCPTCGNEMNDYLGGTFLIHECDKCRGGCLFCAHKDDAPVPSVPKEVKLERLISESLKQFDHVKVNVADAMAPRVARHIIENSTIQFDVETDPLTGFAAHELETLQMLANEPRNPCEMLFESDLFGYNPQPCGRKSYKRTTSGEWICDWCIEDIEAEKCSPKRLEGQSSSAFDFDMTTKLPPSPQDWLPLTPEHAAGKTCGQHTSTGKYVLPSGSQLSLESNLWHTYRYDFEVVFAKDEQVRPTFSIGQNEKGETVVHTYTYEHVAIPGKLVFIKNTGFGGCPRPAEYWSDGPVELSCGYCCGKEKPPAERPILTIEFLEQELTLQRNLRKEMSMPNDGQTNGPDRP